MLGGPLFRGFTLDEAWAKRCNKLRIAVDRLGFLTAQDALVCCSPLLVGWEFTFDKAFVRWIPINYPSNSALETI